MSLLSDVNAPLIAFEATGASFGPLSAAQIRAEGVKKITVPLSFDSNKRPILGGLYDPALGPFDKNEICETCKFDWEICPGHSGYIDLHTPAYNTINFDLLHKILNRKCQHCHHFRLSTAATRRLRVAGLALDAGLVLQAQSIFDLPAVPAPDSMQRAPVHDFATSPASRAFFVHTETPAVEKLLAEIEDDARTVLEQNHGHPVAATAATNTLRQTIVKNFMEMTNKVGRCQNCGCFSPKFTRDGCLKLFRTELSRARNETNSRVGCPRMPSPLNDLALMRKDAGLDGPADNEFEVAQAAQAQAQAAKAAAAAANTETEADVDAYTGSEDEDDVVVPLSNAVDDANDQAEAVAAVVSTAVEAGRFIYLAPCEAAAHIELLWSMERPLVDQIFGSVEAIFTTAADGAKSVRRYVRRSDGDAIFFMRCIYVPAIKYRPAAITAGMLHDHAHTTQLKQIIEQNFMLAQLNSLAEGTLRAMFKIDADADLTIAREPGTRTGAASVSEKMQRVAELEALDAGARQRRLVDTYVALQEAVNIMLDSAKTRRRDATPGIRQRLEKKEGLVRKNMMGKRVNFAARSVISPDPSLSTSEIGIPDIFARTLTFPEPVNQINRDRLARLVVNGPNVWPGANFVEDSSGRRKNLGTLTAAQRKELVDEIIRVPDLGQRPAVVYRHLADGDPMLVNRQPTLHKPSIMAHCARVLRNQRTLRFHYANCSVYNADFDGDEINVHLCQSLGARAEGLNIMFNERQYLVPASGSPARGLIQDHVIAGVMLTQHNTFLTREEYLTLVNAGIQATDGGREEVSAVKLEPPAVLFPTPLWTGKQVITTIIKRIAGDRPLVTFTSASKTPAKMWGTSPELRDEAITRVRRGELLSGLIDKSQLGAASKGLVHAMYDMYGAVDAGRMLSALTRICMEYIAVIGQTCSIEHMIVRDDAEANRSARLREADQGVPEIIARLTNLDKQGVDVASCNAHFLSLALKSALGKQPDLDALLDAQLIGHVSPVTSAVINAIVPDGLVTPFPDNSLVRMVCTGAKGSNVNLSQITSCLGQQVLEGRRPGRTAAGRTLPSFLPYDISPRAGGYIADRFITGLRPQEYFFHAMSGREGLIDTAVKTANSGYLQRCIIKQLEGLSVAYDHTVRSADGSVVQFLYGEDGLDVAKRSYLEDFRFTADNFEGYRANLHPGEIAQVITDTDAVAAKRRIERARKHNKPMPDPLTATLSVSRDLGAVSERFGDKVDAFTSNSTGVITDKSVTKAARHVAKALKSGSKVDPAEFVLARNATPVDDVDFDAISSLRYMAALADPGEAVGVLAGQSIGEPSTQMTLNTFHLAGHGAVNVTLGIPRLREILMTASDHIAAPLMRLPLHASATEAEARALAARLSRVSLRDCLQAINVREAVEQAVDNGVVAAKRVYHVEFIFRPLAEIHEEYSVGTNELRMAIIASLAPRLAQAVIRERRRGGENTIMKGRAADVLKELSDAASTRNEDEEGDAKLASRAAQQSAAALEADADDVAAEVVDEVVDEAPTLVVESEADRAWDDAMNALEKQFMLNTSMPVSGVSFRVDTQLINHADISKDVFGGRAGVAVAQVDITLPTNARKLLMASMTETLVSGIVVKAVHGISRAMVDDAKFSQTGQLEIVTEGTNFAVAASLGLVDGEVAVDSGLVNTLAIGCNDIALILKTLGVEAAYNAIINEISTVFNVYGIGVDHRHLSLVADYMTSGGQYNPYNRIGMRANASPLLKASFETTATFIKDASISGECDTLRTPAARVALGQLCSTGTGSNFDVMLDISGEFDE